MILTPHIGGSTAEAQDAVGVQIAQQVRDYLQRGVVQNAVNMPSLTEQEYVALEPFITLGERLGAFLFTTFGRPLLGDRHSLHRSARGMEDGAHQERQH